MVVVSRSDGSWTSETHTNTVVVACKMRRVVITPSLRRTTMHHVVIGATSLNGLTILKSLAKAVKRGRFFADVTFEYKS
jgi:hypothetical protein